MPLLTFRHLGLACLLGAVAACYSSRVADPESGVAPAPASTGHAAPIAHDPGSRLPPSVSLGPDAESDPLRGLPTGAEQLARVCARGLGDPVSAAFCATPGAPPAITSLVDLQRLVGLDFKPNNTQNGNGDNPAFVLTGNSSSLVARFTSAINPRAIIFTPPHRRARVKADGSPLPQEATCDDIKPLEPLAHLVAMGFTRGEEFVELIAKDPTANGGRGELAFFLFKFEHACAKAPGGCASGDLLTPAGEANFTGTYSLYQDVDLADTIYDCRQCHQPDGPGTPKMLRMQELKNPWAHFFRNNRPGGRALTADYQAAHGLDEAYAGIPGAVLNGNPDGCMDQGQCETAGLAGKTSHGPDPAALQGLVENEGFCEQPNMYDSDPIQTEVRNSTGGSASLQPAVNVPMGTSGTWTTIFNMAVEGRFIPTPYHDVKVTDPTKLATMTSAYAAFRMGQLPAARLPDIRAVFLDAALSDLSFRPAAGRDGKQILVQMCQQCHNARLDQTISRANFRVDDLAAMSREEKDLAITRLTLPATSARKMPPPRFRDLAPAELDLVVGELRK